MKIIDRLKKYIDLKQISVSSFEQQIGASDGMIRRAIKNSTDIQAKWLTLISENYHEINIEWLITGNGPMLKTEGSTRVLPIEIEKKEYREETRPRIPMDAVAGSLTVAPDGITLADCEQLPVIKAFARYDFTIFARGDSMLPEYHSGDELACLYVKNTSFVQWGCCHVLDTVQGIIVKRIYDDGEYILCRSENKELFADFRIKKTEIYNIALVIGLVRRY